MTAGDPAPSGEIVRCPDCGGPLDLAGFHASEWADCPRPRPRWTKDDPAVKRALAAFQNELDQGADALGRVLDRHDYPHCEPCACGAHEGCVGVRAGAGPCCCEAPTDD